MNTDTIFASALAALPDTGSAAALPADIQVFPPGRGIKFTLQDYPGEEFELDVDATVAAKADEALQALIVRSNAGQGAQPFGDKNHEDAEATLQPLRYFWGGDDARTGGVRLAVNWTPFGADLVRAKAFKYFSQNFLFSRAKKKFLGLINENVGGLVNRPGFASQAAYAKAAIPAETETTNTMTKDEIQQIGAALAAAIKPLADRIAQLEGHAATVDGHLGASTLTPNAVKDFTDCVNAQCKANGDGDYARALRESQQENPQLAADYIRAMRRCNGAVKGRSGFLV